MESNSSERQRSSQIIFFSIFEVPILNAMLLHGGSNLRERRLQPTNKRQTPGLKCRKDLFFFWGKLCFTFLIHCLNSTICSWSFVNFLTRIQLKNHQDQIKLKRQIFCFFDNLLQDTCHTHAIKCTDEGLSPMRLVRNISLYSK